MMLAERISLSNVLGDSARGKQFESIGKRIREGAVFIYPTDTIYGIGALSTIPESEERIITIKRRKPDNPMILLAAHQSNFDSLDVHFPPAAKMLIAQFWPGHLTLVLPKKDGTGDIGIRVSSHPFIVELYKYMDTPLFSTSANISGQPYNADPDVICATFAESVDFMIDAAMLPSSVASTVVQVSNSNEVTVVREGVIHKESILKVLMAPNHLQKNV